MTQTTEKKIREFIEACGEMGDPEVRLWHFRVKPNDVVIELQAKDLAPTQTSKEAWVLLSLRSLIAKRYPKRRKAKK